MAMCIKVAACNFMLIFTSERFVSRHSMISGHNLYHFTALSTDINAIQVPSITNHMVVNCSNIIHISVVLKFIFFVTEEMDLIYQ